MPIYEFYCESCHTVFNFFSARIDTESRPSCPRCRRQELPRKPSRFATLRRRGGDDADDPLEALDDTRLEGAMESLMREMGNLDENEEDPRAMARMMRRFGDLTGLEMGERMEDFVSRLEAGEDPETLEEEIGLGDDGDEALDDFFKIKQAMADRRSRRPRVDEDLYFL